MSKEIVAKCLMGVTEVHLASSTSSLSRLSECMSDYPQIKVSIDDFYDWDPVVEMLGLKNTLSIFSNLSRWTGSELQSESKCSIS